MAHPPILVIYGPDGKPVGGSVKVADPLIPNLTGTSGQELHHQVYTEQKDHLYALLYGADFVRKHDPVTIVKRIDRMSIPLMHYLVKGTFLKAAEIRWYKQSEKTGKTVEYFRMILEHVRLYSITYTMRNVKDPTYEQHGHCEVVQLMFQKITWWYLQGNLLYTDIWNGGFYREEDEKDFSEKSGSTSDEEESLNQTIISLFQLTFTEGIFVEPTGGFVFNKKASVRFSATFNRKPDMRESKVFAKLYAVYKGVTEDMHQINEGRIKDNGTWETEFTLRKPATYEKDKHRTPEDTIEYYAVIENKYANGEYRSSSILLPQKEKKFIIPWFIDVHAHINAPKAAPLPVIWVQSIVTKILKPGWDDMQSWVAKNLLSLFKHDLPEYAPKDTLQLGDMLAAECKNVLASKELDGIMGPAEKRDALQILMPMDMEFACYGGYEGRTVYEIDADGKPGYWMYEEEGRRVWRGLDEKEVKKLESYRKQMVKTNEVFKGQNGKKLPFFHYDPRRWQGIDISNCDIIGKWDAPFNYNLFASALDNYLQEFCTIGFKLYTALGYRPDEYKEREVYSRAKVQQRKKMPGMLPWVKNFYQACQTNKIPIICHGSAGGVFAHDYALYYDNLFPVDGASDVDKMHFFEEVFVSPFAWEHVLKDFPSLHLCLAHFGGDNEWEKDFADKKSWVSKLVYLMETYENFYVDLSYFIFDSTGKRKKFQKLIDEHPKIKTKLLFGTDWYLIGCEVAKFGKYDNYIEVMFKALEEMDRELIAYFMVINPKRFLRLEVVAELLYSKVGTEFDIRDLVKEMFSSVDHYKKAEKK